MRRIWNLLSIAVFASLAGCSMYDALFGMLGDRYSSASPDRPSRYVEMQDELDRWEQKDRLSKLPNP